jgi:3D (Asp-Asp-Asp) domain-containing protein
MRIISRSHSRKAVALLIAIAGFVLVYETRILDSERYSWILGRGELPTPGSRLQFSATAYCKGSTTASGVRVRTGVAAADPTLLPVGSVVNIGTGDSKYNGVYTVMDTGPEVKGRELDLYIWSCYEALRFGRKPVQVTVLRLGWDPQASSPTLIDRLFRHREAARRTPPPELPPPAGVAPEEPLVQQQSEGGGGRDLESATIPVPIATGTAPR